MNFATFSQFLAQSPTRTFSADAVLSPYIYVFYAAFIVSFIFTPIMRTIAMYYGIIDQPDGVRKMHSTPVAYLGGVAVFMGWLSGLAISQFTMLHRPLGFSQHVVVDLSIVIGALVIVVLGLWDDTRSVRPLIKILGQVLAAVFLLVQGVGLRCAATFLGPLGTRLNHWIYGPGPMEPFFSEGFIIFVSSVFVILLVVGCCNATNLMDGLDGLCGGVTGIVAAGFLFLAVYLAMVGGGFDVNRDGLRIVLGLALLGAVLGFVPYNFNPASIFMGDTGSMFLGFACATQMILLAEEKPKWFLAAMVMFSLPILDTALAFTRRFLAGRPLFSADKHHFHHQLIQRGLTVKKAVLVSYLLAIGFAMMGAAIVFMRTRYAVAFYMVIFGSIIVAAFKIGMVHEKVRIVTRRPLDSVENASSSTMSVAPIEPADVIEIKDEPAVELQSGGGSSPVYGAWKESPQS